MCGIAGFVDNSSEKVKILKRMTDEIIHRGPDSSGEFISIDNKAALGIRRLSIIDLTTGDQPISSEDGSITVVFNGEIYNYKKLKKDLIKKGHKFTTETDTEVLVHLYEDLGEGMTVKLNGMFAFAIWDQNKEKLFIARDRAGIKPLYYYYKDNAFIFGSEIKTILKNPKVSRVIDQDSLKLYGYLGYVPGEYAIFKGIKKLLPGCSLLYSKGKLKLRRYFQLKLTEHQEKRSLDELLGDAVKMQLNADVPVGVFLSGGLDSSLIAYYISKVKKLKSFSISFENSRYDESKHAKYVAKRLGTKHYDERFKAKDFKSIFNKVIKKLDEPLSDASLLPTYKVSELARKHVKVALSGDGGDELFGGYPTYQAHMIANYLYFLPDEIINVFISFLSIVPEKLINLIPTSFKDYSKKELGQIVLKGLKMKNPERHFYWMRTFFLGKDNLFGKSSAELLDSLVPETSVIESASMKGQFIDFHSYLRDDFLVKSDRASMFNSLEVRVPFLDNDVIDYAFSKNIKHLSLTDTKIELRKLLKDTLPEIAKRPKKGFGIPLHDWIRNELKEYIYSFLENKKLYYYMNREKIDKLWKEHQTGNVDNSGTLWQLTVLSAWLTNWT